MDLFSLTSKTGIFWTVPGAALVSVRPCKIYSYYSDAFSFHDNIGGSSHLQTNRNFSISLALHFALGYSRMSNIALSSLF